MSFEYFFSSLQSLVNHVTISLSSGVIFVLYIMVQT